MLEIISDALAIASMYTCIRAWHPSPVLRDEYDRMSRHRLNAAYRELLRLRARLVELQKIFDDR